MNGHTILLGDETLTALPSGALWHTETRLLCVSDLHLGKSERIARRGGTMLPPYGTQDTLRRLEADLAATGARRVICLGDSFDDLLAGSALGAAEAAWIARLQSGRDWIWVEGNHDPGPCGHGGTCLAEVRVGALVFRHIAAPDGTGEVSGHYHPKARFSLRGRAFRRPCFLHDARRLVMPAYGTYTGGLDWTAPALQALFPAGGRAVLVGERLHAIPMPRACLGRPAPRRAPVPEVGR